MDKKTQNLDPALKATYERVMGTNLSQPNSTTTPPQSTVPPTQTSTPPQPTTPFQNPQAVPPAPTSPTPTPAPSASYTPPQPTVTAPPVSPAAKVVAAGSSDAKVVAGGSKKSGGLSPILIAITVILFFSIYTLVWLFVFKVKLPFIQ